MKRDRLPLPVGRLLGDALDEQALARVHRRLEAARAVRPTSRARAVPWLVAAAAAIALAFVLVLSLRPAPGPVTLASGAALAGAEVASGQAALRLALDDGSSIVLEPGAKLAPLENGADRVALLVERGRVRFEIEPGGKRRWTIDAGAATVEVVGTGFVVDRDANRVRVEVAHGVVLVRGERVAERVRRLEVGDVLEVPFAPVPSTSAAPTTRASSEAVATASASASGRPLAGSAPAPWRARATEGDFREAYRLLGEGGIRAQTDAASVDDLFLLADVARLSGHPAEAVAPLERIVARHASDPRAALAAFTLGKITQASNPGAAAAAFERALALGLSSSLRADATSRWVEACIRASDAACEARARRAADGSDPRAPLPPASESAESRP